MPNGIERCLFVNSPIAPKQVGGDVQSLRNLIRDTYVENLG